MEDYEVTLNFVSPIIERQVEAVNKTIKHTVKTKLDETKGI